MNWSLFQFGTGALVRAQDGCGFGASGPRNLALTNTRSDWEEIGKLWRFIDSRVGPEAIFLDYGPMRRQHHEGRIVLVRPPVSLRHMFHHNLDVEPPRGAWDIHRSQDEGFARSKD